MTGEDAAGSSSRAQIMDIITTVTRTRLDPGATDILRSELDEWDSLAHVEILFTIEEYFDVEFDEAAMRECLSASEIAAQVARLQD